MGGQIPSGFWSVLDAPHIGVIVGPLLPLEQLVVQTGAPVERLAAARGNPFGDALQGSGGGAGAGSLHAATAATVTGSDVNTGEIDVVQIVKVRLEPVLLLGRHSESVLAIASCKITLI